MRLQEIPDVFLEKAPVTASSHSLMVSATKALLRSSCGVLSRSYGVLVGDSMRSHGAFKVLTFRAPRCHGVRTALSRRLHCADVVTSKKKYANIRNCSNQNPNPALKTKTGNNYMCNVLRGTRNLSF